jgi:hypothetical protein
VGAALFTLASGRFVHDGDNAAQLMVRVATARARSLSMVAPAFPSQIVDVVDRALAFEKAGRWPTAAAMRDRLAEVYLQVFGEPVSRVSLMSFFADSRGPVVYRPGGTTAQPVSAERGLDEIQRRRTRRTVALASGAAALVMATGAVSAIRLFHREGVPLGRDRASSVPSSPASALSGVAPAPSIAMEDAHAPSIAESPIAQTPPSGAPSREPMAPREIRRWGSTARSQTHHTSRRRDPTQP